MDTLDEATHPETTCPVQAEDDDNAAQTSPEVSHLRFNLDRLEALSMMAGINRFAAGILTMALASPSCLAQSPAPVYAEVSVEMPLIKVTDDVYYVQGLPGAATEFEGFVSSERRT